MSPLTQLVRGSQPASYVPAHENIQEKISLQWHL